MFAENSEKQLKDKVLILYFIHHLNGKLSRLELTELFISNDIFEYFTYSQHLNALIDKDMVELIETNTRATYHITESGLRTLNIFEERLNTSKLNWGKKVISDLNKRLKEERQLHACWEKLSDNNYQVTLEVNEGDWNILKIDMSFVNNEQAQSVCKVWKDKASDIYGQLIQQLLDA